MAARGNSHLLLDTVEELLAELPSRLRGSRERLEGALGVLRSIADELNLVTRDELDELELRVAQLEHRLRLLEQTDAKRPLLGNELRGPESAVSGPLRGVLSWVLCWSDFCVVRSRAAEAGASAGSACG